MNNLLKSIIIYCELFLLTIYYGVAVPITPNYYGERNSNSIPKIERNTFISELYYVRDNQQTKEERPPQTKSDQLFLGSGLAYFEKVSCYEVMRNQSLITTATPEYLLSSDLKSPPKIL